jgi:hypothetical protein
MSARRSPCTMKMALFHEALLHMDNLTHLSIFQILRLPFSKQRFCSNRRSAATTRLRPAGSPLGASLYGWGLAPFFLALSPSEDQFPGHRAPVSVPHPSLPHIWGRVREGDNEPS